MPDSLQMKFGRPEEWSEFSERNPEFVAAWDEWPPFIDRAFSRVFNPRSAPDRVVFTLGRLAVEDFLKILLVAGNGYGIASLRLLRSLFERMVTMMYLIRHPEETDDFLNFHWVHIRKALNHVRTEGGDPVQYYSRSELDDVEAKYPDPTVAVRSLL